MFMGAVDVQVHCQVTWHSFQPDISILLFIGWRRSVHKDFCLGARNWVRGNSGKKVSDINKEMKLYDYD